MPSACGYIPGNIPGYMPGNLFAAESFSFALPSLESFFFFFRFFLDDESLNTLSLELIDAILGDREPFSCPRKFLRRLSSRAFFTRNRILCISSSAASLYFIVI